MAPSSPFIFTNQRDRGQVDPPRSIGISPLGTSSPSVRFLNREFPIKNVIVRSRGERRAVKSSVIDRAPLVNLQIGLRIEPTGIFRIYLWTTVGRAVTDSGGRNKSGQRGREGGRNNK